MYPALIINKEIIKQNVKSVVELCSLSGVGVSAVIKGCSGNLEVAKLAATFGCKHIASSRVDQLMAVKEADVKLPTMLLRIPMLSEVSRMIKYADISLQSELKIIDYIEKKCKTRSTTHNVVLMMDLGDLREGYMGKDELIKVALYIENNLKHVKLHGIGTNLGCYGSILATTKNLGRLADIAIEIEGLIGRELDIVSGGATSSLTLVAKNEMPSKINNLRIGEAILTSRELSEFYDCEIKGLSKNAFTLKAEVVEIKEKPTHPIGELFYDAFGNKPEYEDRGSKTRMILAVGRIDIGDHEKLIPLIKNIEIIGSSSDHLIVESISDKHDFKIGSIIEFELFYPALLYLSHSPYVTKVIKT